MDITDYMESMTRYRDWGPTQFDHKGLGCDDQQDWVVCPVSITRDTPDHDVDRSNWEAMIQEFEALDPEGDDHEVHRFGHWGPGWFEIILVRPNSACHRYAAECACALGDYPILDEHDHSEREFEAECDAWKQADLRDRIEMVTSRGFSIFAARSSEPPSDDTGGIRDALLGYASYGRTEWWQARDAGPSTYACWRKKYG